MKPKERARPIRFRVNRSAERSEGHRGGGETQVLDKADTCAAASALIGASWDVSMAALSPEIGPVARNVVQATPLTH